MRTKKNKNKKLTAENFSIKLEISNKKSSLGTSLRDSQSIDGIRSKDFIRYMPIV